MPSWPGEKTCSTDFIMMCDTKTSLNNRNRYARPLSGPLPVLVEKKETSEEDLAITRQPIRPEQCNQFIRPDSLHIFPRNRTSHTHVLSFIIPDYLI